MFSIQNTVLFSMKVNFIVNFNLCCSVIGIVRLLCSRKNKIKGALTKEKIILEQ